MRSRYPCLISGVLRFVCYLYVHSRDAPVMSVGQVAVSYLTQPTTSTVGGNRHFFGSHWGIIPRAPSPDVSTTHNTSRFMYTPTKEQMMGGTVHTSGQKKNRR